MKAVLGIDAAWTKTNPSGVALIRQDEESRWQFVAVAPSYESFIELSQCISVDWDKKPSGGIPEPGKLLEAAKSLLQGGEVTIVSVDMPLSHSPITKRRICDKLISRKFGSRKCGTHSPCKERPGAISDDLRESLEELGYKLCVSGRGNRMNNRETIEVYPHTALLYLLNLSCRLPYKVTKSTKYWPCKDSDERKELLVAKFREIEAGLRKEIGGIPDGWLRMSPYRESFNYLKRYEDALDALICTWVGARYIMGRAVAYGDAAAAIWVPCI